MVEQSSIDPTKAMQRLHAAMQNAELEDSLRLVAVLRKPVDADELQVPAQEKLVGWAIWPSTMHIAQDTFGDTLEDDAPLLDAEWVEEGRTIRVWRDEMTLSAVSTEERDPPDGDWHIGEQACLCETVAHLCETPANARAIYHVYWILDPESDTLVRAFDRFVGYHPAA